MSEKQASSEIAEKSMNKSEIAERARKRFEFEQYAKTVTWNTYEGDDDPFAFFPESGVYANGDIQLAWLGWQWRERAIAESQAKEKTMSNYQRECLVDGSDCGSTTCPRAEDDKEKKSCEPHAPDAESVDGAAPMDTQQSANNATPNTTETKPDFAESAEVLLRHLAQATGEPTKQAIAEDALYRMWIGQRIDDYAELGDGEPSPDENGISKETLLKIRQQLLHRLDLVNKKLSTPRCPYCKNGQNTLSTASGHRYHLNDEGRPDCVDCKCKDCEGVAAPLEPTERSPLIDIGPIYEEVGGKVVLCQATKRTVEMIKHFEVGVPDGCMCCVCHEIREMITSHVQAAAAVSKNLQQELAELKEHCISEHDCTFCGLESGKSPR